MNIHIFTCKFLSPISAGEILWPDAERRKVEEPTIGPYIFGVSLLLSARLKSLRSEIFYVYRQLHFISSIGLSVAKLWIFYPLPERKMVNSLPQLFRSIFVGRYFWNVIYSHCWLISINRYELL